jgi:hypothetical protein
VKSKRLYIKARRYWREHIEPISRDQLVLFFTVFLTGIAVGVTA